MDKDKLKSIVALDLPRWNDLPDFDIYNDQLVSIVTNVALPLYEKDEKVLTSTMVNNYVKWHIITKPYKKRYERNQIASLIVIACLKNVLNIKDIGKGIEIQSGTLGMEKAYDNFCDAFERSIKFEFYRFFKFLEREEMLELDDEYVETLRGFINFDYKEYINYEESMETISKETFAVSLAARSLANKLFTEIVLRESK